MFSERKVARISIPLRRSSEMEVAERGFEPPKAFATGS